MRGVLAAFLPLTPDEAYYWVWSRHLQAGYLDHPPMVALWIYGGTWLLGQHPIGIRVWGVLASLGASVALVFAGRRLFPETEQVGERAACLLNVTLLFGVGMASMTPDTPLMFFSALSLWALSYALTSSRKGALLFWWGLTGICLGLAAESKYTAIFLALGIAGYVALGRANLWRRLEPWLGAALATAIVMPVIWWNASHHWASFVKQGGRAGMWHPTRALQFVGELFAGQIGLMTPFVFLCVLTAVWRLARTRQASVLLWCLIPGGLFFLFHACGDRVQANWPSVLYPVCALAAGLSGRYWRLALSSGVVMSSLVGVQALWQPLPIPAHWNPIVRQTAGWDAFAHRVEQEATLHGVRALVVEDYALASILAFYRHDHNLLILGQDPRWVYLEKTPIVTVPRALMVHDAHYVFSGKDCVVRSTRQGYAIRGYHLQAVQKVTGTRIP